MRADTSFTSSVPDWRPRRRAASVAFPNIITTAKERRTSWCSSVSAADTRTARPRRLFEPFEKEIGHQGGPDHRGGPGQAPRPGAVQERRVGPDLHPRPPALHRGPATASLPEAQLWRDQRQGHQANLVTRVRRRLRSPSRCCLTYSTKAHPPARSRRPGWTTGIQQRVPGHPRVMYNAPPYSLEFALIADGCRSDKLYPLDVGARVQEPRPHQAGGRRSGGASSRSPACCFRVGRDHHDAVDALHHLPVFEGEPLGISYEGAAPHVRGVVVPRGAPNSQNAMRFINWALQPKPQADLTSTWPSAPPTANAAALVNPKLRPLLVVRPGERSGRASSSAVTGGAPTSTRSPSSGNEWRLR